MVRLLILWLAVLVLAAPAHAQDKGFWDGLQPGPHDVGFRLVREVDLTRPPVREQLGWAEGDRRGRYVQIGVWYPAQPRDGPPLTFQNYIADTGAYLSVPPGGQARDKAFANYAEYLLGTDKAAIAAFAAASTPMRAVRDALPLDERFPTVIVFHSLHMHVVLAEYLASHGYVVAALPPVGTSEEAFDFQATSGVETEVRDGEFALAHLKGLPFADTGRLGVVGHSYGAQSAAAFLLRHPDVRALVSLDGGIGSRFGAGLLGQMPYYSVARMDRPILHQWTPREAGGDPAILDRFKYAERLLIEYPELRHIDFGAAGLADARWPGLAGPSLGEPQGDVQATYREVLRDLGWFLDAHLRGASVGRQLLIDRADGVRVIHRPGIEPPPGAVALGEAYDSGGMAALMQAYESRRKLDPEVFEVETFVAVWSKLNTARKHDEAEGWAVLFRQSHPAAAMAPYLQARSLASLGQKVEARQAFETSLALLPADTLLQPWQKPDYADGARRRMAELDAKPAS